MKKLLSSLLLVILMLSYTSMTAMGMNGEEGEEEAFVDSIPVNDDGECPEGFTRVNIGGSNRCIQDQDEDRISDTIDNCPEVFNPSQDDTDEDGTGDPCDDESILQDVQNEFLDDLENTSQQNQKVDKILDNFKPCLPINSPFHRTCNADTIQKDEDFQQLYEALLNNQIMVTLDEPLSNENVYRKARVCTTKFLKDINGLLQPVSTEVDLYNALKFDEEGEVTNDDQIEELYSQNRFLITNDKCEEFYVRNCQPRNANPSTLGGDNPLPTRVFCSRVQIIFGESGSGIIKNYVGLIYRWAAGIIGVIAVAIIIINGIVISVSGGNAGKVESAKNRIVQSLTALAILFLSGIILFSINPNFFRTRDLQAPTEVTDKSPEDGGATKEPEAESK